MLTNLAVTYRTQTHLNPPVHGGKLLGSRNRHLINNIAA